MRVSDFGSKRNKKKKKETVRRSMEPKVRDKAMVSYYNTGESEDEDKMGQLLANTLRKKRTVPSIPIPEKQEEKLLGPWSYTPKDDIIRSKPLRGIIHSSGSLPTHKPTVIPISEDNKLRYYALKYLK